MTVGSLLSELRRVNITLTVEGNELRFRAPIGAMTAELKATLAGHKAELVEALRSAAASVSPAIGAAAGGRDPLPEEITHKRRDCHSRRSWQHVWGDFYCLDCWPPTDPLAVGNSR
jgi:hypothetical protein